MFSQVSLSTRGGGLCVAGRHARQRGIWQVGGGYVWQCGHA